MNKYSLNDNWILYRSDQPKNKRNIHVPFDAMTLDDRSEDAVSGVNLGWIEAKNYTYIRELCLDEFPENRTLLLEFEGIYHKASVYVNDTLAAEEEYGYMGIWIDATGLLRAGKNEIRVEAINEDQPNSRWYSGTGIYRPVWLYELPEKHILPESIRVTTIDYKTGKIQVEAQTVNCHDGECVQIEIAGTETIIKTETAVVSGKICIEMIVPNHLLWSVDQPNLYTARVVLGEDTQEVRFGIRQIGYNAAEGFTINGQRILLKGACFHHDNGLIGAAGYAFADYRKVKILKKAGYNALRSAHNPVSKAILEACDELGMLMMDEYVDVWYIHKTKYDYAGSVMKNYKNDLARIVAKDYNHPSVVMYSTGNEVAETGEKKGIAFTKELTETLHELDATRPVTCGINIFFNFLYSMGMGVYSDKKADAQEKNTKKKKTVGSEFFNNLAGVFGADFMKFGATLYPCDVKTRDAFANMDIAGYNYGIFRYEKDLKKYPDRLILGSETFCSDAYRFYEVAKNNPRIIGDFVWSGMDYLGEVGIGAWEYNDYAKRMDGGKGWVSAGSGRIDLLGHELGEMQYTRVAFEQDQIGMAVVPVNGAGKKHSPSSWKFSNAIPSWDWEGMEGKKTTVEVYTRAASVKLYLNGKCIGRKKFNKNCIFYFENVEYQPGILKAVGLDENGKKLFATSLHSGEKNTTIQLNPEQHTVSVNDLVYMHIDLADKNGVIKSAARDEIQIQVEGGSLLGIGSACPYYDRNYTSDICDTYYGQAMAIIRPNAPGTIKVTANGFYGHAETCISVTA